MLFLIELGYKYILIISKDLNSFVKYMTYSIDDDLLKKIFEYSVKGNYCYPKRIGSLIMKKISWRKIMFSEEINWDKTDFNELKKIMRTIHDDEFISYMRHSVNKTELRIIILDNIIYTPIVDEYNDEVERIEDVKKIPLTSSSPFVAF